MSQSFAYTTTTSLTTTLTAATNYPAASFPLSTFSPSGPSAPVIYTTLPNPDPSAAKLVPVLVVAEWEIFIVVADGNVVELKTTRVTPDVSIPLPSETTPEVMTTGGRSAEGGQKAVTRVRPAGWESWTGKERWGVCAAVGVAVVLLLAAGGWFLWVKLGKGRAESLDVLGKRGRPTSRYRPTRPNVVQAGETRSFNGVDEAGRREGRLGKRSQSGHIVGHGREALGTRYEMSGALGSHETEMNVQGGHRPLLLLNPHRRASSEGGVGGTSQI